MKSFLKQIFIPLIVSVLVVGGVIFAGDLTPITQTPEATYVTLEDIYEKLTTGVTTTEKSFTPSASTDTPTMHTLTEIFDLIYDLDTLTTVEPDLTAENIVSGTTIFGVEGSAEIDTGLNWDTDNGLDSTWGDANSYCLAKGGQWRLPHIWELSKNSIDGNLINLPDGDYWTDQSDPPASYYRVTISDSNEQVILTLPEGLYSVRCIQD